MNTSVNLDIISVITWYEKSGAQSRALEESGEPLWRRSLCASWPTVKSEGMPATQHCPPITIPSSLGPQTTLSHPPEGLTELPESCYSFSLLWERLQIKISQGKST